MLCVFVCVCVYVRVCVFVFDKIESRSSSMKKVSYHGKRLVSASIWFNVLDLFLNLRRVPTPVLELICTFLDTQSHVSFAQVNRSCRKVRYLPVYNFIEPVV